MKVQKLKQWISRNYLCMVMMIPFK